MIKLELTLKILLYPNPTNDKLFVEGLTNFDATIFDLTGKKVLEIVNANRSIDMSELKPGIYMLHLTSEGNTYVKKVVKQ